MWLRARAPCSAPARGLTCLGLALVVIAAHGGSLGDGLFFDDYWHRATLGSGAWSWNDLIEAATFDLPGPLANLWWQERPLQWRYARPVAMFFMKIEYLLSGGDARGVHAFALLWHWLSAALVAGIARRVLGSYRWAFLAGALFALQPQSVFGIGWTAARNAIVGGCFFALAIYAFLRARDREARRPGAWLGLCVIAGALSLFSRETAIILPFVLLALDAPALRSRRLQPASAVHASGTGRVPGAIALHVVMFASLALYLWWRLLIFPKGEAPSIYYTTPQGLDYIGWAASKLLHMLFALTWSTPLFLGLATFDGVNQGEIVAHGLMLLGVTLPLLAYVALSRGLPGRWVWPIWIAVAFVPVIPVFLMPHFAYLPATALAIMVAAMAAGLPQRWRGVASGVVIAYSIWCVGIYRYVWRGIVRCEQVIYADIQDNTAQPAPGAHMFFINLPPAGIYAAVAMREAWGVAALDGHILTFSPHPLIMDQSSVVERVSEFEFTLQLEPPGYFSGMSGRMLRDGMRPGAPLDTGTIVRSDLFDVTVLEGSDRGVTSLKFSFHQPLDSPNYYFYVGSPERPAMRIFGSAPEAPLPPAVAELFRQASSADAEQRATARESLRHSVAPIARSLAAPMALRLRSPLDDAALDALEAWWRRADASRRIDESRDWLGRRARELRERQYYFTVIDTVRAIVQTDLLLTGGEAPTDAE